VLLRDDGRRTGRCTLGAQSSSLARIVDWLLQGQDAIRTTRIFVYRQFGRRWFTSGTVTDLGEVQIVRVPPLHREESRSVK